MEPTVAFPRNWTPPRELRGALPRETHISGRGMFNIVLGSVFLIAAVYLGVWMHDEGERQAAKTATLHAQGQEVTGEINKLWLRDKGSEPMVGYAFTANGVRITGEATVPKDRWPGIRKAGFLPVRFLPSNPAVNHPSAWDEAGMPAWFPFVMPLMWLVASVLLLISQRRQRQVAAEGVPAAGVVTSCSRIKGGWAARYQFRTNDGLIAKGRNKVPSRVEAGATVCVLYLPRNPRRCYIYPLSLYRVVQ
jgi:hypothetical protein